MNAREESVIELAQQYSNLKHPFDDAALLPGSLCVGATHFISGSEFANLPSRKIQAEAGVVYSLLLPEQAQEGEAGVLNQVFSQLNELFKSCQTHLLKADTTFSVASGVHEMPGLFVTELRRSATATPLSTLVSVDAFVLDRHFTLRQSWQDIGFYVAAAACSDVLAKAGMVKTVKVDVALSHALAAQFGQSLFEHGLADFLRTLGEVSFSTQIHTRDTFPTLMLQVTVVGAVDPAQALPLAGLGDGMRVYVFGRLGGPASRNYAAIDRQELIENVAGRRVLIEAWQKAGVRAACATDTSDGLAQALLNLHRFCAGKNLAMLIDSQKLNQALSAGADLEAALYGGDDYAWVFALPKDFSAASLDSQTGCFEIGSVQVSDRPGVYISAGKNRMAIDQSGW